MNNFINTLRLSRQIAKIEFKVKNAGTYFGLLWYVLNPLLMFILLFAIFSKRLGGEIDNYALYLIIGITAFNFFSKSTTEATRVIIDNRRMIKTAKFSLESLVGSVIIKNIYAHIFELAIVVVLAVILSSPLIGFVFYPLFLFLLAVFVYGFSLILAAISVFVSDLINVWAFVSRLIWFATPIFYSVKGQSELIILINKLNPMYYFISLIRETTISLVTPPMEIILGAVVFTVSFLFVGSFIFNRLKGRFAEMV